MNKPHDSSKRKFIKTAAYVAPAVVTLAAMPSFASAGSVRTGNTYPGMPGGVSFGDFGRRRGRH